MRYAFLIILSFVALSGSTQNSKKTSTAPAKSKSSKPEEMGVAFFDRTMHDFGKVVERKGKVETVFTFTNIGKGNLQILDVNTSCGCTASEWSKDPIKPGEKGSVKATYNPKDKSGGFRKLLTVQTNGDPANIVLTIQGDVVEEEEGIMSIYPLSQGNMRFSRYNIDFKSQSDLKADSIAFTVYNASSKPMLISGIKSPPHINTTIEQKLIPPGGTSSIMYRYYAAAAKDYGPRSDETFIYTNDDTLPVKRVLVKSDIYQDFSRMTDAEKKNAPKISFSETEHDMGELYIGESVSYEFEVTNKGKSDLLLKRVKGTCGCTVGNYSKELIKKGQKGKIKVTLNTTELRGRVEKLVYVYSNDPTQPAAILKIKATVIIPGVDPISK